MSDPPGPIAAPPIDGLPLDAPVEANSAVDAPNDALDPLDETAGPKVAAFPRRHDLDALRAWAMLAGIALHGAMSFAPDIPIGPRDVSQSDALSVMFHALHGFRMPVFFVLSGFFTMMLWRRRGLRSLLWHRTRRILFPIFFPGVPIIVALFIVSGQVERDKKADVASRTELESVGDFLEATDVEAVRRYIAANPNVDIRTPDGRGTPLQLAALGGHTEVVAALLKAGADPNFATVEGNVGMHGAALFGRAKIARMLLEAGAWTNPVNKDNATPPGILALDMGTTQFIAGMLQREMNEEDVIAGRIEIGELLAQYPDQTVPADKADDVAAVAKNAGGQPSGLRQLYQALVYIPVFFHLWFLNTLLWLVALFAAFTFLVRGLRLDFRSPLARALVAGPWRYAWLVPVTFLLQRGMTESTFGPDTTVGLVPRLDILAYYAVFFFFGAIHFDAEADNPSPRIGRGWRWLLPASLLVLFPIGLDLYDGRFGLVEAFGLDAIDKPSRLLLSDAVQALFAWTMTFGLFGFFRWLMPSEGRITRYISDSSYWLYLAHLPLIMGMQNAIRQYDAPALLKFGGLVVVASAVLLASYHLFVRYTPIGWLLNGRRARIRKPKPAVA